jgi:hypothetical protein
MARIFSQIRVIRFIREIRVKIFALARTLFTHEPILLPESTEKKRIPMLSMCSAVNLLIMQVYNQTTRQLYQ